MSLPTAPTLTKTSSVSAITIPNTFIYTLTIDNSSSGTEDLTNIMLIDVLPSNVSFVSIVGGTYDSTNNQIKPPTATIILQGATYSFMMTVKASIPGTPSNEFTFNSSQFDNLLSNSVTVDITKNPPPLPLLTKISSPSQIAVGQIFAYTLIIDNSATGAINLTNVVLTDSISMNLSVISVTGALYSISTNTITITVPSISASSVMTIVITVLAKTAGTISNTFSLTGTQIITPISSNILTTTISYACPTIIVNTVPTIILSNSMSCPTHLNLIATILGGYSPTGNACFIIDRKRGKLTIPACVMTNIIIAQVPINQLRHGCYSISVFYSGDINNGSASSPESIFYVISQHKN